MTPEEIAKDMAAFHNNEAMDWNSIQWGYKKPSKQESIEYVEQTIKELKEMLEVFKK